MPEGPSIVILKEAAYPFKGKKIIEISGSSKIDQELLLGQKIIDFKSWGKHFLICFKGFTVRIHFLLFGSYMVNEKKDRQVRLSLVFGNGEINFYACAIKILEGNINVIYDWSADVMSDSWDGKKALAKLKNRQNRLVCDALLDQDIFSGVGNIIKNELLYRTQVHPCSLVAQIPSRKMREIIKEARVYSFEFLEWKKTGVLKKHWLSYSKKMCVRCKIPLQKEPTGKGNRKSFFCTNCQVLYNESNKPI